MLLAAVTCTSSQYKCPDVEKCISKQDQCNGNNDCPGGGENEGSNCCTSSNPCGEGKGDCDNDNECQGNLKCGDDNCNWFGFDSTFDCCAGNFVIMTLNKVQ